MSIYVMTVGELAKKRGEPVGEFVKKVQATGFEAGSHAKKLTQEDLNQLIGLLDGTAGNEVTTKQPNQAQLKEAKNPNVIMIKVDGKYLVALVDASLVDGEIRVEEIQSSVESSLGEGLLEFRKQLGMKLGVN